MIDFDEYPAVMDDEEEQRRKKDAYAPVAGPPLGAVQPSSYVPAGGLIDTTPPAPDVNYLGAGSSRLDLMRPRPKPSEYQPPEHHGLGKVGMAAAGILGGAGVDDPFRLEKKAAEHKYEAASGAYDKEFGQQKEIADLSRQESSERSQSELRGKQGTQYDMVPLQIEGQTEPIYVQKKDVGRIQQELARGRSAEKVTGVKTQSAEDIAAGKTASTEKIAVENIISREKIDAANNAIKKEIAQLKASAANDPNKLTTASKNMVQLAKSLLPEIDVADQLTRTMSGIGPIKSRWRDLWAGKVGEPDPAFIEYKDHMNFLMTGITLAHARGRMSNELFEHFQEMFNAGKQSPENMEAALKVARNWMENYSNLEQTVAKPPTPKPAGGGTGKPPAGASDEVLDQSGKVIGHAVKDANGKKKFVPLPKVQ